MIEILKKIFKNQGNIFLFSYLFGSRAKENHSESSDFDIAVYLNEKIKTDPFDIKTDLYLQISKTLKHNNIDIVIMNQCKNIILLNQILTHGILLYDSAPFFRIDYEQKILHSAIDFKSQRKMAIGI